MIPGDGVKTVTGSYGTKITDNNDALLLCTEEGSDGDSNKYLALRYATVTDPETGTQTQTASYSNILFVDKNPDTVVIRMKFRIEEDAYFYANDAQYTFRFRRYEDDGTTQKNVIFAKLSKQSISVSDVIEGDKIPDITQWTDVEFVLNARAGVGIYRIGGAEGTFTFDCNNQILGIQLAAGDTATGLYIDDLSVVNTAPENVNYTYTASVTWDDAHDYDGTRPESIALSLGGQTITVNEACNWQADFTLPAFDADGNVITYEPSVSVGGYDPTYNGLSITLAHEPVLHATVKEGVDTIAYFYNDFEGYYGQDGNVLANPVNHFYTGADLSAAGNLMYMTGNGDNGYMTIDVVNSNTCYYQPTLKNYTGGDFAVSFKLNCDDSLPNGVKLAYRYGSASTYQQYVIEVIYRDSILSSLSGYYINDTSNSDCKLASGWNTIDAVFDIDGYCTVYVNGTEADSIKLESRVNNYIPSFVRLNIPGSDNVDKSLLLDDFMVYPGTDILSVDEVLSPGYYYTETGVVGKDDVGVAKWDKNNVTADPDVLKEAVNNLNITWPDTRSKTTEAMTSAIALYYMVLSEHMTPGVKSSDGVVVADEAAARIKLLVSGGHEPWASVGCHWGHGVVATTMALAKNTPTIWSQLSADDISRVDLLMECLAIAANWGFNSQNSYTTGFELAGDFYKTSANFINAYLTCYMSAAMYFDTVGNGNGNGDGNGEELDAIFTAFDYNSYITRLEAAGFTDILFTWTTVEESTDKSIGDYMTGGGEVILNAVADSEKAGTAGTSGGDGVGVKVAFTYKSPYDSTVYGSSQLTEIFIDTIKHTYSWQVTSSNNSPDDFGKVFSEEYAYLLTNEVNPRQGQMGMMREYAQNSRSRSTYCYLSAVNIAPLYANMKLLGYWDYSDETLMRQMDNRIYVGTEDLFWKMDQGYYSVSTTGSGPEYWAGFATSSGGIFIKDIFWNFHFAKNADITWEPVEVQSVLEDPAPVDESYAGPAADAIYAQGNYAHGYNLESNYVYLFDDQSASSNVKVSFDLVINNNLIPDDFRAYIMLDKAGSGRTYKNAPVVLRLEDGLIQAVYKNGFWNTFARFGENYRYHVDIEVDCVNKVYNITIQQVWPEVDGEPIVVFERQSFASHYYAEETTEIDSILVMSSYQQRCIWVENLTAEKVE